MAITKTSTLTDTIPTILEKARLTEQFATVMAQYCWNIPKKLHSGSNVNVPYFGTVTAQALTEGVDLANPQTMSDTTVTITPGEVGCQILVTDKLTRDDQEDIVSVAGEILGQAIGTKKDQDIWAQLDDGTTSLGSNSTLTMGVLAAGRATLLGNAVSSGGPCPGPYRVFLHPYVYLDLVDVATPILPVAGTAGHGATSGYEDVVRSYEVGRLFGMTIIEDGNTAPASNVSKGGIIGPRSIILSMAKEWDIEEERDASLRATELNAVTEYGVGEYLAGWIIELACDATAPA